METGAQALSHNRKRWIGDTIGSALAGGEIGATTGGPAPLTKQDRSRFLGALDAALVAASRVK
jgi:uncharacterized protein YaiI (UPF0178 family)